MGHSWFNTSLTQLCNDVMYVRNNSYASYPFINCVSYTTEQSRTNFSLFSLWFNVIRLGYLKDSNAAVHSVGSAISYTVIHLPVRSRTYTNP